jgi:hypothetical protein
VLAAGTGRSVASRSSDSAREPWDDERRWDGPDPWEDDRSSYRDPDDSDEEPPDPGPAGVPPAVAVGLGLWRWWLCRSGSWRGAVALGLVASVTTVLGGPVVRAVLTTLAAAAELLAPASLVIDACGNRLSTR